MAALILLAALFALLVYVARRAWRKPPTEAEDEKRFAIQCWLEDFSFLRTAYQAGVIDREGVKRLQGILGTLRHAELDAVMYRLLGPRECRVAAAAVMERHSTSPGKAERKDCMRKLTDFVIRMREGEKLAVEVMRKKGKG